MADPSGASSDAPPPYAPKASAPQSPVVVTAQSSPSVVVVGQALGPYPTQLTCPNCRSTVQTRVEYSPGLMAWLVCGILILFGLWCGCCLIPFCMDELKDAEHFCPSCRHFLGHYRRC